MNKKTIDNICWFIPIKRIRNLLKKSLYLPLYKKLYLNNNDERCYIIRVSGGFSDQIHWYLIGKALGEKYNAKIKYDISACYTKPDNIEIGKDKRNFDILNVFPDLDFEIASDEEIDISRAIYTSYGGEGYSTEILDKEKIAHIGGCPDLWVTVRKDVYGNKYDYFYDKDKRNEIFKHVYEIIDNNEKIDFDKYLLPKLNYYSKIFYDKIKNTEISVGIHIRRGDYFSVPVQIPDEYYFLQALKVLKNKLQSSKIKVFIFSDDVNWVKEKLLNIISNECDFEIVENHDDRPYVDMYLISTCKHQIISVGGFGLLAHKFNKNKNKIIITPKEILNT